MRNSLLGIVLSLLTLGVTASAQTPTAEDLQSLKDSMSPDDQSSLLQGVLGKGDGTGKKSDQKLNNKDTVQPKDTHSDMYERGIKIKTRDGRTLRQPFEDPELRPGDSVLIELNPRGVPFPIIPNPNQPAYNTGIYGAATPAAAGTGTSLGGAAGAGVLAALGGSAAAAGSSNGNGSGANGQTNNNSNGNDKYSNGNNGNNANSDPFQEKPKTDEEMEKTADFRRQFQANNPYKLNRFGVLEIPGLPAIPLAGLTAIEATTRLNADPDFRDFNVRLVLLRLQPSGDEALKPFGYDLFEGVPSTFAPVSDIQVPPDYVVGPGDNFDVLLYGSQSNSYTLTVERDGRVNFPKLGPIMVSGMSFDAARAAIEQRVAQQLIGTRVSVTMGDLRSIRVFILGEAEKPGSYTVSGLSTMTNALFVSGGVKKIGSLRSIELKRNGRLVSVLDLYDLLLHGDTSGDRQLMPGDVIFIPPIGNTVSVDGAVRRPAIYELKTEKTVEQAVALAGGLTPGADQKRGQMESILPSRLRQMHNIDLTVADGRSAALSNGDKLRIPEIRPTLENSVKLSGYVFRPGEFEYHAGLRLSDILNSFDELQPTADKHYVMIRREVPPEERIEVLSADLERALTARGSAADPELRPRDQIVVYDLAANRDKLLAPLIKELELQATPESPEQIVSIDGKVKAPGRYPLEPTMHVSDLIRAGGSLGDAAYGGQAELTRYAVANGDIRQTELIPVNLDAIRHGTKDADLQLRPYDKLIIKPIPSWMEPGTIEVAGEVRFPGKYPIHQGETLHSVLHRAGGFTDVAFPEGSVFIREELKKRERDQLELLANRLQSDLAALSLEAVASSAAVSGGGGGAGAAAGLTVGQQLLLQLRDTKPVGRLVVDVDGVIKGPSGGPDDVLLKDGDKLIVPKKMQEITILGEVESPTSHVYQAGLTRDDYIGKSGGATQKADKKRIYVVRANGDVVGGGRSGWFRRAQSVEMRPGDTIVVPLDTERVRALPLWQAVTTIIYNLAIGLVLAHQYL
jgi:polysaccharide export outer membrane protein